MPESDNHRDESEYDYERYLRIRSLNASLSALAPWAYAWMLVGITIAGYGYASRPEAVLVGLDPAGRSHSVQTIAVGKAP